jgi:transposase
MPMEQRTLVPDAGEVVLDQLMVENNIRLVMVLRSTGEGGHCPVCRQESQRVHSRYRRRLSDLPWEGIPVRIELRVRRFFCDGDDCCQKIFTERLPKTVQPHARRTCRLSVSLQQITCALGRVCRRSPGEATRHPGQQFNTSSPVAQKGNQALRTGASGVGHR